MMVRLLMIKRIFLFFHLLLYTAYAEFDYSINNTNITSSLSSVLPTEDKEFLYNYNRLRFQGDYINENYFSTIIADAVNYLGHNYINSTAYSFVKGQESDTPFETQTSFNNYYEGEVYAKLYRLYGGYEDNDNRIVVGLQKITMGVGRIWTPSDIFNPKNIYALEPDEVFGVAAINYTRHLNETSKLTVVTSQKKDKSFKYAARYKSFLKFSDVAVDMVSSDDTKMLAYELEGNLADTGIELRSEGAFIKSKLRKSLIQEENREFFQGIIGADYGFENGLTLVTEALYSSKSFDYNEIFLNLDSEIVSNLHFSKFYLAGTLNYSFNIFLDASLIYIESFNEHNSRFISPSLSYTLNDFNSFVLSAMLQHGSSGSEFGDLGDSYYFKYVLSF